MTTDEIYERYLRKAITEINRLSHEIAQAADGAPTALPTGHPLANIFLLKYGPQAQELQEGVAFHGRAGNALIKSLQRLHVDPMEVYGTNAVKFAGCDLERRGRVAAPRAADRRAEARRRDGRGRARVPERHRASRSRRPSRLRLGELQRFTPTIEALAVPDIDSVPRRGPCEDSVLERVQDRGPLVGRAAAVLTPRWRVRGLCRAPRRLLRDVDAPVARALWWDVAWIGFVLIPAVFGLVLLALPLRDARWLLPGRARVRGPRGASDVRDFDVFANFARLGASTLLGWWFLGFFETVGWVVLVAAIIPWVDAYSVWRGPTKQIVEHHADVFERALVRVPGPGEHAAANLGVPDLLFFALFLGAAARFGLRVTRRGSRLVAALGLTIARPSGST